MYICSKVNTNKCDKKGYVLKVSNEDIVMDMAYENNGIVRMREIEDIGISSKTITRLVEKGKLKKASKGIYVTIDFNDKYYLAYIRCRQGIFSHESALILNGVMEDNDKLILNITIPSHYNTRILTFDNNMFYYLSKDIIDIGKKEILTKDR